MSRMNPIPKTITLYAIIFYSSYTYFNFCFISEFVNFGFVSGYFSYVSSLTLVIDSISSSGCTSSEGFSSLTGFEWSIGARGNYSSAGG